jgi:hypothetical protein
MRSPLDSWAAIRKQNHVNNSKGNVTVTSPRNLLEFQGRSPWLVFITIFVWGYPAIAQQAGPSCTAMKYENRNQTDYGPLQVATIRGTAKDAQGVMVPGVCVGIFTPTDHKLVLATQTDSEGRFEFKGVSKGEYRLVASCEGFCSGNAKIRVQPGSRSKKRLDLVVRPAGLDTCSYFELK